MTLDPFEWSAPAFLIFCFILFLAAQVASTMIIAAKRPDGSSRVPDDPDALAMLAGGPLRFGEAMVARMLVRGDVAMTDGKTFTARSRHAAGTGAERALLALPMPTKWEPIADIAKHHAKTLAQGFERHGLYMTDGEWRALRWWGLLPFVTIAGIGIVRLALGIARGEAVGFLLVFLLATGIAILIVRFSGDRRTKGAHRALRDLRERHIRLKSAPTRDETGLAVALFGTAVLAGSPFAEFHALRQASGDSGSSDGGSSDSGDGGCGGGGCGGCGS